MFNGRLTPDIWLNIVPFVLESRKLAAAAAVAGVDGEATAGGGGGGRKVALLAWLV